MILNTITVAAAIILNEDRQVLVVRKHNTQAFMQVGGKLEADERAEQAMCREIQEEIGCTGEILSFVGRFETQAANEPDHQLIAYLYHVAIHEIPHISAEIAEMKWIQFDDEDTHLAPLTREIVLPWCKSLACTE